MFPLVALLLIAAPSVSDGMMAVLELRNQIPGAKAAGIDAGYFSNRIRTAVLERVPELKLMTRENMVALLAASGKSLDQCEGECEVDTGRRLGADWVISGDLLRIGTNLKLDLRMHETAGARMLAGAQATGKTVDELDAAAPAAVARLLAPLLKADPAYKDSDGDGVPDRMDKCPTMPGPGWYWGCPLERPRAQATNDGIQLRERVSFGPENRIDDASGNLLLDVAELIKASDNMSFEIQSHGDSASSIASTQRRAEAVRAALIGRGVTPDQLFARGMGGMQPLVPNTTPQGREINSRIEIRVRGRLSAPAPGADEIAAQRLAEAADARLRTRDFAGATTDAQSALALHPRSETTLLIAWRALGYSAANLNRAAEANRWLTKYQPYCSADCAEVREFLGRK